MNAFEEISARPALSGRLRQCAGFFLGILAAAFSLASCMVHDAKAPVKQSVTVYTDHLGENDSLLFAKFRKEEKIEVYFKLLPADSILAIIQGEKYNSYADLILLHGADQLQKASKFKCLSVLHSEKLLATDKNYISPAKNWIALSKSPIVLIYDRNVLKADTISFYNEVLQLRWKGKIALQDASSSTLNVLAKSMSRLNPKYKTFLPALNGQSALPRSGGDLKQIKRVQAGQAQLAFVELSSLAKTGDRKDTLQKPVYRNIGVIFPGQKQKGAFYNVTGAGVHRYARNPANAEKLLEFLSSKRAQYDFAAGRMEFPVLDLKPDYRLEAYGKFRARFLANRVKQK